MSWDDVFVAMCVSFGDVFVTARSPAVAIADRARMPVLLLCLLLAALVPAPAAARTGWARPVLGAVGGGFHVAPSDPYARGQRRGADLRALAGEAVRAPCTGRVSYAGVVPGRRLGLSVRCGRLTATVLGLASVGVRPGMAVLRGRRLGRAAGGGVPVRLGARVTSRRFGYVDPLALLGPGPRGPRPLVPLRGPGGAMRGRGRGQPVAPAPTPVARVLAPVSALAPSGVPLVTWGGLALAALGLPALVRPRRRARRARAKGVGEVAVPSQ